MISIDENRTRDALDMAQLIDDIEEEILTPYITIPTRSYAKLCAAIHLLGGNALDVVGNAPYFPVFRPEPDPDDPDAGSAAAKAIQLICWGDNGLKAIDKQCYELILRMTKTQPGQDCNLVRINLGAIAKRLGHCHKTTSTAFQHLVDLGLLESGYRIDPESQHKHIYARAGRMPVWGERYAESEARAKDAARKRRCEGCGSTRFAVRHVCKNCGLVQTDPPRSGELIDQLADTENAISIRDPHIDISRHGTLEQNATSYKEDLVENHADAVQEIQEMDPLEESSTVCIMQVVEDSSSGTESETLKNCKRIYHIGPRIKPDELCISEERHAVWVGERAYMPPQQVRYPRPLFGCEKGTADV